MFLNCGANFDMMEDDPQWKTTFDGRQLLMDDSIQWKMTFCRRQPSFKNNLQSKTTVD